MAAVGRVVKELLDLPAPEEGADELETARNWIASAKKAVLFLSGAAYQKFGEKLADQQEVLAAMSDLIIELYLSESAVLRARKAKSRNASCSGVLNDLALIFVNESVSRTEQHARRLLGAIAAGDELKSQMGILRRLLRWTPLNGVLLRRKVAQRLTEVGSYPALVA